jgi:hypothetical protein
MVRMTSRDRNLLHWHDRSVRGLSPLYAEILDNQETIEDPSMSSEMAEEDFLFPVDPPAFMLDMAHSLTLSPRSPLWNGINNEFLCRTKTKKLLEAMTVARDFIFAQPKYTRLLSRLSSHPLLDPCFKQHQPLSADFHLFLDYLPLLRCMAVQERIAEYLFKVQESSNDGSSLMNKGRRTTRRSLKRGREQYFETIVPSYLFVDSNKTAKDIVELLANTSLLYVR